MKPTLALLSTLVLAACGASRGSGSDGTAADGAGTPTPDSGPCVSGYPPTGNCYKQNGVQCRGDECLPICYGIDGGVLCNQAGSNEGPAYCCGPGTKCCDVAFEQQRCLPAETGCPFVCTMSGSCPADKLCGLHCPCGGYLCDGWWSGLLECLDECPAGQACGRYCCGSGTRCVDGYCQSACEDGGAEDAADGGPDGGGDDGEDAALDSSPDV